MVATTEASTSPRPATFASLLAGFTSPAAKPSSSIKDGLEDDIATISYEQALRTHARPRSSLASEPLSSLVNASGQSQRKPLATAQPEKGLPLTQANGTTVPSPGTSREAHRKSASITIRLSEAECAQLHERAQAAELTISAYLRSCIFEAESLRTQVRDALAQLRPTEPPGASTVPASPTPVRSTPVPSWRSRLILHWTSNARRTA